MLCGSKSCRWTPPKVVFLQGSNFLSDVGLIPPSSRGPPLIAPLRGRYVRIDAAGDGLLMEDVGDSSGRTVRPIRGTLGCQRRIFRCRSEFWLNTFEMVKKGRKFKHPAGRVAKTKPALSSPGAFSRASTLQQAQALHQAGRLPQAEALYRQILSAEPSHPEALQYLGVLAHQVGKSDIAIELISKAVRCRPDYVEAYYNLGIVLLVQGKMDEAVTAFCKALSLKPDYVEAHNNLGNAHLAQGKLKEAISSYRRALALRPDYIDAHYNLGNALRDLGDAEEACVSYRRALNLKPDYVKACYNLGKILQELGKPNEAAVSYRRALTLQPDYVDAHNNLGNAHLAQGKLDEAIASFQRALALKPDSVKAYSNQLLCLNYLPDISQKEIYEKSLQWDGQIARTVPEKKYISATNKEPAQKLKIGYVSSDFREHSVAYFIEPVLKSHNREDVEIYCYANVKNPDDRTRRLQRESDHWCFISGKPDIEVAERIRSDGIDILVDLGGHTAGSRLLVFAYKPSPIQITWLGYPNTTGMGTIDYRLTDAIADPVGEADNLHSEELIRLEHGFLCYEPDVSAPAVSPLQSLEVGHITFASFNNLSKITPEVVRLWADILHQVSRSRLILKSKGLGDEMTKARYRELFAKQGIPEERLELHGWIASKGHHLGLYRNVDIGLDTFPYNGTTTTCEALWMGVPVVTLCGNRHAARVGASIMHHAGMVELVAHSMEEYAAVAVSLAHDQDRLRTLRGTLRQKLFESRLMDRGLFVETLEKTYREMWCRWCSEVG